MRETNALRDLLNGFVQARRVNAADSEVEVLLVEDASKGHTSSLILEGNRHIQTQVISTTIDVPEGYEQMTRRATRAALARIIRQVESLDAPQQNNVCNRIRGCYDGFFMNTGKVWQRRLQGWKLDDLPEALERLCLTVSEILGVPVLFDPFEAPDQSMLRPVPTFCFIVTFNEHLERIPFHIPISSLMMTTSMGVPPLCLRMIDVPSSPTAPCRWLCDTELTMRTMQGQPVHSTLASIDNNRLRMLAFE